MGELAAVLEHGKPTPLSQLEFTAKKPHFEYAPFEPITGLPHAIAPSGSELNENSPYTSWHHPWHTEAHLLSMGEIGRAIRTCRLQLSLNEAHNFGKDTYHTLVDYAKIPSSTIGRVRVIIFSIANAVTDQVLDVKKQVVRPITPTEKQQLFYSGEIRMQSEFSVRRVLTRFVINQGIDNLKRSETRQYKDAKHQDERESIANSIIGRFLPIAFEPINERFEQAKKDGFLPDSTLDSPAEIVSKYVFNEPDRFGMFDLKFLELIERREVA
jgi:hypothetical protein